MIVLVGLMLIVFTALVAIIIAKKNKTRAYILLGIAIIHFLFTLYILNTSYFDLDALSKLILITLSTLYLGISFHGITYFAKCQHHNSNKIVTISLVIFITFATLMIMAQDLISMWIFLETASLACTPLIYYNKTKASIEATWKYLFLCSIGIVLALIGMLFISYAASVSGINHISLEFTTILSNDKNFNPIWLKISFVFMFIGFATKTGLFPFHSWKADAYGVEPGIFGGLMAGGVTSLSWLALIRLIQIMNAAGESTLVHHVLIFFGIISILYASIATFNQLDIKKILAYSSIEHMGIIALGFGVGGVGVFGALFHIFNNALLKGAIFMVVGNIRRAYGQKTTEFINGAMSKIPLSGTIFFISFLAIVGTPPFGSFVSMFSILQGVIAYSMTLAFLFMLGLILIFIGMGKTILGASRGKPQQIETGYKDTLGLYLSPLIFSGIILGVGIMMPDILQNLIMDSALLLEVKP